MESQSPSPESVNEFAEEFASGSPAKPPGKNPGEINDRRTWNLFDRFEGYLNGALVKKSHGKMLFYDWGHENFVRVSGTKGGKKVSLRTIERQFPRYLKWSDSYRGEKISVTGKDGKARWVVRITKKDGVQLAVPGAMIRDRIVAAIKSHVAKAGRTHVGREFTRKFAELSALPLSAIEGVLHRDKNILAAIRGAIPGVECKWRGVGVHRKILVTDPARWAAVQKEGREKLENLFAGRSPGGETAKLHPRSAFLRNERLKNSGTSPASPEDPARAAPAGGEAGYPPPDDRAAGEEGDRSWEFREPAAAWPLQICGRFIGRRKMEKCARWLAGSRLKRAHWQRERVTFLFPHAFNFAVEAMRAGYSVAAIERAYAKGVQISHEDALDVDKPFRDRAPPPRVPSAAKVYAWRELRRADPRSPEQLWAEFFAAPRRPRDPVSTNPRQRAPRAEEKPAHAVPARERDPEVQKLRAKLAQLEEQQRAANAELPVTAADVIAYLESIGMNIAELGRFGDGARRSFFTRAAAWKKAGGKK